jgi:hypothetical protein
MFWYLNLFVDLTIKSIPETYQIVKWTGYEVVFGSHINASYITIVKW